MRALIISVLISLSFILSACGGGGGGGGSTDVKVSLGLNFENARAASDGFYVSNTKIKSVSLSYTNNAGSSGTKVVTADAADGNVQLNNLVQNTTYTFTVTAISDENIQACTGSTSVLISPNATNSATLECNFIDSYAMGNAVFDFVELIMQDSVTAEQLDEYVAVDFGVYDGLTREQFIADIIDDSGFFFTEAGITLTGVEVTTGVSRAAGTDSLLKFYFSDGTVVREYVTLVKEGGSWKLTGNGKVYEAYLNTQAYYTIPYDGSSTPSDFYSGVATEFYDESDIIDSIKVSGSAMSQDYTYLSDTCVDCDGFYITDPDVYSLPYFFSHHFINLYETTTNPAVAADQEYTISAYFTDNSEDVSTLTAYGKPIQASTLDSSYFPMIPESTSQNMADYILNSTYTFNIVKPTAYEAESIEVDIEYSDYYGYHDDIEFMVPLTADSFTLDFTGLDGVYVTDAAVFITAYDSDGRAFTTIIELYYDDATAVISSSGYVALSDAVTNMTTTQLSSLSGIISYAGDSTVRAVLVSMGSATSSGLTATDVNDAYTDALSRSFARANPYSAGTPQYDAYEALVDSFYGLISSGNSSVASSILTFVADLSPTGFQAFGTLMGMADGDGFAAYAQVLMGSVDEIIAEIEEQTGEIINTAYEVEEGLSFIKVTNGSSYYNYFGTSGFYKDGAVICNSGNYTTASIYIENPSSETGDIYTIENTTNEIRNCYKMLMIEDEVSSYYGYSYAVLGNVNSEMVIVMFDNTGSIVWANSYNTTGSNLLVDAELSGENLIVMISDVTDENRAYFYEVLPDATTGTNTSFTVAPVASPSDMAAVVYKDLIMQDGVFAVLGTGQPAGADFSDGLIVAGSYLSAANTTFSYNGAYFTHITSMDYGDIYTTYTSGYLNGSSLMLSGIGHYSYDDFETQSTIDVDGLVISSFDTSTGYFDHGFSLSNNYVLRASTIVAPDSSGVYKNFALISLSNGTIEALDYDFDGSGNLQINSSNAFDYTSISNQLYATALTSDNKGHLLFTGKMTDEYSLSMLLGAMSADDLTINGSSGSSVLEVEGFEDKNSQLPDDTLAGLTGSGLNLTATDITSETSLSHYISANPSMELVLNILM